MIMTDGQKMAAKARHIAGKSNKYPLGGGGQYNNLSAKMCWDAAITCGVMAGVLTPDKARAMTPSSNEYSNFVDVSCPALSDVTDLEAVPPGSFLGFFWADRGRLVLFHVMVYIGDCYAAGTKNACMGIGTPVGWEVLDLRDLNWSPDGNYAVVNGTGRPTMIRYRSLGRDTKVQKSFRQRIGLG